jgi:PNGase C-terminal domain, mannose-binding module PAW
MFALRRTTKKQRVGMADACMSSHVPSKLAFCVSGWRRLVYAEQNMQCKVEKDWKMAYLARLENSVAARIEWRFDLTSTGQLTAELEWQRLVSAAQQ